jgi:phage I-like protein|tara:strand:- start:29 stop:346 length:318 start_codon:yes stop_codon:yes gene_type:complete
MSDSSAIKRKTTYDHVEDKIVQHSVQDVQPLLELNKKEYNKDYIHGGVETKETGMRKVASIPLIIVEKWKRDHGIDMMNKDHWPKIKQLLNSNEYKFLRTHESNL